MKKATFGAGCFWGVEAAFRKINGVVETSVGYMGGYLEKPTYEDVCTNKTGHAEVVQVTFDENEISYDELLDIFFEIHDPTQLNKQGPDIGTQYRSVIFYHSEEQRIIAEKRIQDLQSSGKYKKPIVTELKKTEIFYPAEEYHQRYLEKQGF
jgi:peptide-methionine (S)-S-oxide reductase